MSDAFKELADFCQTSDDLTLSLLCQKLEAGPNGILRGNLCDDVQVDTTLLHCVCYNPKVTLEIVQYLVSIYPEAVKVRTDYGWHPLHRACNNASCPDEVVEYLVDLYPESLGVPWPRAGLPLHCLLSRPTRAEVLEPTGPRYTLNMDLVRTLVEAHPAALVDQDNDLRNTPLLCACAREDLSMDMIRLLLDPDLSVLELAGEYQGLPLVALMKEYHSTTSSMGRWRPPDDVVRFFIQSAPDTITASVMNEICRSRNVTLDIVELAIEARPDVSLLDEADGESGMLPLHSLCLNENREDQDVNSWLLPIIEYVVGLYPDAVRRRNNYGFLPLTYAVNTTLDITKFLVEQYPESVSMIFRRGTSFHCACRYGSLETVKYLYEKNPDVIKSASYQALHLPFEGERDVEAKFNFLLQKEPKLIRGKDRSNGNIPLHAAVSGFHFKLSLIKQAFELYPDAVATRNNHGRFPLHEFLARDRYFTVNQSDCKEALDTVIFLVKEFPSSVRVADDDGMLPLHYACKHYHGEIILLLSKVHPEGIKVESPKFGLPLHCLSEQDESKIPFMTYLLSLHPEAIRNRNENVGLPLECAKYKEMFEYLLSQQYAGKTQFVLHHVLRDDALLNPDSVVQMFLRHFCGNLTQVDNFGQYPLHVVVSSSRASHYVVKEFLTVCQAAAEHQDKQGRIPLHLFFRHSTSMKAGVPVEILRELLSSAPNSAQILDNTGSLPLHFACRYGTGTDELVRLIESFPDAVRVADQNGCIPLHVACRRATLSIDAIKLLVAEDETTIQTADNDLELPLHKACRGGHLRTIHYLLDQFAPASSVRNASGSLPVHILCRKSGKVDMSVMDTPIFTETVFRLLRAHPEAVMI